MKNVYIYNINLCREHDIIELIKILEHYGEITGRNKNGNFRIPIHKDDKISIRYEVDDDKAVTLLCQKISKEATVEEMVADTVNMISDREKPDKLYIHASGQQARPPLYNDYVHVKAVRQLIEYDFIENQSDVIFFTGYPGMYGFSEETGFELKYVNNAKELMGMVMNSEFGMQMETIWD